MKKTLKMILCLAMTLCLLTACTVVNVAKAGSVNGEEIPLGVYKYCLRIAEVAFGQADYENKLTSIAAYEYQMSMYMGATYSTSVVFPAINDIISEAGVATEGGENIWDKAYGETTVGEAVKTAVFDEIVKVYVGAELAAAKELALTEDELKAISSMKSNLYGVLGSKAYFDEAMGEINLSANQLTDFWSKVMLASKLANTVSEENAVSEEDIENYFNENYVRVKHILIMTGDGSEAAMADAKTKADAIIAKLNAGEDFETLMAAESDDVDAEGNVNGGEEGYIFDKENSGMVKPFEKASLALGVDEYTKEAVEVNATDSGSYSGYHIIKRYEMPENHFAENKEALSSEIESVLDSEAYEAYIEEAYTTAEVVKNESKIKGVKLYK